ncbi:hypothetical protein Bbelb_248270 [Branchiostoma belcheri]|nr:hypothetical protein Bbelb_248270 [Branchiostoma belcheri]
MDRAAHITMHICALDAGVEKEQKVVDVIISSLGKTELAYLLFDLADRRTVTAIRAYFPATATNAPQNIFSGSPVGTSVFSSCDRSMKAFAKVAAALLLAAVTVYYASCSPCKPPVAELCSCKDGLLDSGETCTVCACSQDGNYRQCTASRWLEVPSSWILDESSGSYCSFWSCYYTVDYAWKAFDGDATTAWAPLHQPDGYQHWVILDLQTSFSIQRLSVTNMGDPVHDIVGVTVESSLLWPYTWVEALSSDAVVPSATYPQQLELQCTGRYLRLNVNTESGTRPILAEVSLYGIENTGGPEGLPCPTLNTGCVISDTAGETAPPGGQSCYVTADIHEGLRSSESPLSIHRTGNVTLHGDLAFNCGEHYELQVIWTARGYDEENPDRTMDEFLLNSVATNGIHLFIPPKTLPLGKYMIQLQAIITVPGSGHVSVSAVQTWIEFASLPVVYSMGSLVRTVPTSGDLLIKADSSYDPEELMVSTRFTYRWTCTLLHKPALPKWSATNWRCGPGYAADYSIPAECDPNGIYPCCSPGGWCGNTPLHCSCAGCIDYRGTAPPAFYGIDIHSGVNVAERGQATSSVVDGSATADRVIDGNTDGAWSGGSCMHTPSSGDTDPWVQIDLCHAFAISSVTIYNRADELPERANPFNLHMGDSADITQNPVVAANLNFGGLSSWTVMTIPVTGVTARYVGIVLPGPGRVLHICEFQVYVDDDYIPFDDCLYTLGCEVPGSSPGELLYAAPTHNRPPGMTANITVEITAGENPPITLYTIIEISPDATLTGMDILCAENCNPTDTLSFLALELYTESDLYGTTEFSLVEFPAEFAGQDWTSGIESQTSDRLRVLADTFWAQGHYTIRITDVYMNGLDDWSRTAEYRFEVLPPPEVILDPTATLTEACTLLPAGGVSLIDKFCLTCSAFTDILGPVEVSVGFELVPVGVEIASATFPGDGPPAENDIIISALPSLWVGYTPLMDLASGTLLLTVRASSVDGRHTEFQLAPIEIEIPTMAQLQAYLDSYFAYPDGDFFQSLALGDTQAALNVAIFASDIVGKLAFEGQDTIEAFDKITEALSHVEIDDAVKVEGVALSVMLATGVPEMVSGESQVLSAGFLKAAFETTKHLAGDLETTHLATINKLSAFMFSGSVNVMLASSTMAIKEHQEGINYSPNLLLSQNATTTCFEGFNILDDIYLTKLMPEFSDPEIFADISMSKDQAGKQDEGGRTNVPCKRRQRQSGQGSFLLGPAGECCWASSEVGIQFLEANFNPFEYSNNSQEVRSDVTGLAVKYGSRTRDVRGLNEPIDILTRRKNESLDGSVYVFETAEPLGSLAVFHFLVGKEQSALGFSIDFNSTRFPQEVSMFLRKGGLPTQDVFNWTATLPVPEGQLFSIPWINGTNLTSDPYQWLLPREEVDVTAYDVGNLTSYFIGVQIGSAQDLDQEPVSFILTVFTSSCVYFDEDLHLWQTDGCKLGPLTNSTHIHCRCDHLTKFAGFVPPNPLNIQAALSANVLENPSGLALVLSVFAAYLLGVLLTRKADRRDLLKAGVGILPGHVLNPRKECQYVITVYTGFRGNAGTTAEVTLVLGGFYNENLPFRLRDSKRVLFEKGSVDSFLVSTEEPLGDLTYIRVWHNNQGYSPGWLSVEEDDGNVHRVIPRAIPEDLQKFRNLFLAKSARDMNDGHMWFSVVGRPARSPFTRVQRLSCCMTLLYCTMLTNIMFFGRGDDFDPPEPIRFAGTEINPPVSLPQIMIGIQSAVIILPVNILIAFLFRNSGPRVTNTSRVGDDGKAKSSLPWWAAYIGWMLVWSASFVSAFFTVLYSLSFGRAKAEAWAVTFLTSFFTDLFLMQPFKLMLVAVVFALISKKPVEDEDPPAEPLQPDEEFLQYEEKQGDSGDTKTKNTSKLWRSTLGWRHYIWRESPATFDTHNKETPECGRSDSPPDESTLAEQRQKSAEKRKRRAAVLEVLMFGVFIIIIMAVSYGERSPMAFYMTQNVERQILESGNVGFFEISDIPSCWSWITTGLLPALHAVSWYNGRGTSGTVLPDMVSHPLGPVQLRQPMLNVTTRCSVPYSLSLLDTQNYTSGWAPLNATANSTGHVCDSPNAQRFPGLYDCADVPYFGTHGSYIGGGYITQLASTNEATFLQDQNWLDEKTRALFIELILYNPHVNLFSVLSLVVEFTNLGSVYKSSEVITVRLIQHDAILLLVLRGVLALFLLYFVLREGKSLLSRPLEYLWEFWSWVELAVITIGFSTIGIYFKTQNIIDEVAEQRKNGNSSFHLYKSAVSWLQTSTYLQGLLISFATLKFIRLLRFNSHETAEDAAEKVKESSFKGKSNKPKMERRFSMDMIPKISRGFSDLTSNNSNIYLPKT